MAYTRVFLCACFAALSCAAGRPPRGARAQDASAAARDVVARDVVARRVERERAMVRFVPRVVMIGGNGVVPSGVDPTHFDRAIVIVDVINQANIAVTVGQWAVSFSDEGGAPLRRVRDWQSIDALEIAPGDDGPWQLSDDRGRRWLAGPRWQALGAAGAPFAGTIAAGSVVRLRLNGWLSAARGAARRFSLRGVVSGVETVVEGDVDAGTWPTG